MSIYSTSDALDQVFEEGERELVSRWNVSHELIEAIHAVRVALDQDSYTYIADDIVAAWEYYGPMMYEAERERWAYYLIDPLLDLLR